MKWSTSHFDKWFHIKCWCSQHYSSKFKEVIAIPDWSLFNPSTSPYSSIVVVTNLISTTVVLVHHSIHLLVVFCKVGVISLAMLTIPEFECIGSWHSKVPSTHIHTHTLLQSALFVVKVGCVRVYLCVCCVCLCGCACLSILERTNPSKPSTFNKFGEENKLLQSLLKYSQSLYVIVCVWVCTGLLATHTQSNPI